jgi:hypothetical protein
MKKLTFGHLSVASCGEILEGSESLPGSCVSPDLSGKGDSLVEQFRLFSSFAFCSAPAFPTSWPAMKIKSKKKAMTPPP